MNSEQQLSEQGKDRQTTGKWLAAFAIFVGFVALAVAVSVYSFSRRQVQVRIVTDPPGASVWIDERFVGSAPCDLSLSLGRHLARCARHGYQSVIRSFTVGRSAVTLNVKLNEAATGKLRITTEPPGAVVAVDGVDRGPSPVEVSGLKAGQHEIVASAEAHDSVKKTVTIQEDEEASVHLVLPSKIEAYYLNEIKQDPKNLHNYTELLHYYVLQGEFKKAQGILTQALVAVAIGWGRLDQTMRLTQELQKICDKSFEYEGEQEMRRIILETLRQVIVAYPRARWLYRELLLVCRSMGNLDEAVKVFELGAKEMPWDPWINGELARLYLDQGNLDEAEKVANRTIHLSRGSAVAHYVLGCICRKRGEKEKAREHFEWALRFSRDWALRRLIAAKMRGL